MQQRFKPAKYNSQITDDSIRKSTAVVLGKLNKYFDGKEQEVYDYARYVVDAMRTHWDEAQLIGSPEDPQRGEYWHNWTYVAATNMFFQAYKLKGSNVGFYGYYGSAVYYAATLEANRGGLASIMNTFSNMFFEGVERIYGSRIEGKEGMYSEFKKQGNV